MTPPRPRSDWLDVLKGLGILAVVAGHTLVAPHRFIFWFHMPLFFVLAGMLYRPGASWGEFARRRALRLLLPYAVYLVLIGVPYYSVPGLGIAPAGEAVSPSGLLMRWARMALGGRELQGWCAVFWFATSLFLTQIVYHALRTRLGSGRALGATVAGCYAIAVTLGAAGFRGQVPWAADTVPLGLTLFWCGQRGANWLPPRRTLVSVAALLLAAALTLDLLTPLRLTFDMKKGDYGLPLVGLMVALACIALLAAAAARLARDRRLGRPLARLGRASLAIMFLHQPAAMVLTQHLGVRSELAAFAAGVLVPLLIDVAARRSRWASGLLLGEWDARLPAAGPRRSDLPAAIAMT